MGSVCEGGVLDLMTAVVVLQGTPLLNHVPALCVAASRSSAFAQYSAPSSRKRSSLAEECHEDAVVRTSSDQQTRPAKVHKVRADLLPCGVLLTLACA